MRSPHPDEPAGAGRRRLGQDDGGAARMVIARRERLPGRVHGPHRDPGRAALPDLPPAARALPATASSCCSAAVKGKERDGRRSRALASGEAQIAVGTHALIQEGVRFQRLGLAVVDEQHRFGVLQRDDLRAQGLRRRRAGDDRHADPAHAGPHRLRRPRRLGASTSGRRAARRSRTELRRGLRAARGRSSCVRREVARGAPGLRRLPAGRGVGEARGREGGHRRWRRSGAAALPGGARRPAARPAEERGEGGGDGRLRRAASSQVLVATTVIEVGVDVPNATRDGDRARRALRPGPAPPAPRPRRPRQRARPTCLLVSHGRLSDEARARLDVMVAHRRRLRDRREGPRAARPRRLLRHAAVGPAELPRRRT